MELHSPSASAVKKLWSSLRVTFFMIRKGLISKRKLVLNLNLTLKRWKLLGKSIVFHHHHQPRGEYEFSCTNSPNPIFSHAKRRHIYFPCINVEDPDDTPRATTIHVPRIDYSTHQSPLSARVSNCSVTGDENDSSIGQEVDAEAEEFIRRFYEQLRVQSRIGLLQYQEIEYQEM